MRTGFNPNRRMPLPEPLGIVVAAIVHLPNQDGYHAERMEIVKLSLNTMRDNAGFNVDVLIWDNGSCEEMTDWLENEYDPDYLILSKNVGKWSARASIFHMFSPETIIALADDDMYYYEDWLEPQLDLLTHFPNVGVVSGYPVRTQFRWGCANTLKWAKENAELKVGRFIPDEWERDFAISIGRDPEWHLNEYSVDDLDIKITYGGMEAYGTAHHCQFLGYAGVIAPITKWDARATSNEKKFDEAIDAAGLLRLTTIERLTRHMGNVMEKSWA